MIADRELLINFVKYRNPRQVDQAIKAENNYSLGYGSLPILIQNNSTYHILILENVQLVTELSEPIMSVAALNSQFKTSVTLNVVDGLIVRRSTEEIEKIILVKEGTTYILEAKSTKKINLSLSTRTSGTISLQNIKIKRLNTRKKKNLKLKLTPRKIEMLKQEGDKWHERLGHISAPYLN